MNKHPTDTHIVNAVLMENQPDTVCDNAGPLYYKYSLLPAK